MTASDAVCITLDRKAAENISRKALNNGKSGNRIHLLTLLLVHQCMVKHVVLVSKPARAEHVTRVSVNPLPAQLLRQGFISHGTASH